MDSQMNQQQNNQSKINQVSSNSDNEQQESRKIIQVHIPQGKLRNIIQLFQIYQQVIHKGAFCRVDAQNYIHCGATLPLNLIEGRFYSEIKRTNKYGITYDWKTTLNAIIMKYKGEHQCEQILNQLLKQLIFQTKKVIYYNKNPQIQDIPQNYFTNLILAAYTKCCQVSILKITELNNYLNRQNRQAKPIYKQKQQKLNNQQHIKQHKQDQQSIQKQKQLLNQSDQYQILELLSPINIHLEEQLSSPVFSLGFPNLFIDT